MNADAHPRLPGKTFSSRVAPRGPRLFVLAGIAAALLMTLGLVLSRSVPIIPTVFAIGLVFHYWPAISGRRPQLIMNTHGLWLDGMGQLPWHEIQTAQVHERKAGERKLVLLEIQCEMPPTILATGKQMISSWRGLQSKLWRELQDHRLIVVLSGLEDSPEEIRTAFEMFWGRKVLNGRGIVV